MHPETFHEDGVEPVEYIPPITEREPVWVGYAPAIASLIVQIAFVVFGVDLSAQADTIATIITAVLALGGGAWAKSKAWAPANVAREVNTQVAAGQIAVRDEFHREGAQYIIDAHDAELDQIQADWELDEEFS